MTRTESWQQSFPTIKYDMNEAADYCPGLTKREYFAALALQGILARGGSANLLSAAAAVQAADHLIEALNKPQGSTRYKPE